MILKAGGPVPTDMLHLSAVDNNAVRVYTQTVLAFDFPDGSHREAAIAALQEGLHSALARFPFLAGTLSLRDTATGRLVLTYPTEPPNVQESTILVTKVVHDFPYTYEQLKRKGMPASALTPAFFVPEDLLNYPGISPNGEGLVNFEKSDAPVMRIQVNFVPGGLIMAMYFHHATMDCHGITTFWSYFASQVSRARLTSEGHQVQPLAPVQVPDQSKLRWEVDARTPSQPLRQPPTAELYIGGKHDYNMTLDENAPCALKLFVVSASRIQAFRDQLRPYFPKDSPPSIFSVLAALLWIHVTRARAKRLSGPSFDHNTKRTNIGIATDLRKRMKPRLGDDYLGNMALFSKGTLTFADVTAEDRVTEPTIVKTINEIRRTVEKVDDTWVHNHLAFFKSIKQIGDTECALEFRFGLDMYITSWMDFGADIEWGIPGTDLDKRSLHGRPGFVRRVYAPSDGGMMILPRRRKPVNGVEAPYELMVRLAAVDMETLIEEKDGLGSWAERIVD